MNQPPSATYPPPTEIGVNKAKILGETKGK